jgi:hypothetical protein
LKYLFLSLIVFLTSCSLSEEKVYINKVSAEKTRDFMTMTFEEFNLFLKDYSENMDYPDINK